jgi:peptidoglycan/xylan/chitin deacetylase (PgdA/CDA1 family)
LAVIVLGVLFHGPAAAQNPAGPGGQTLHRASPDRCARGLGVARAVSIDAAATPRLGHQQYKDVDFLEDGEIVLTFDDGPLRVHTQAILDTLDAHCTKATFFMVGVQALADPDMVRRVAARCHTIGTHTYSHANLRQMDPLRQRREIEMGISAVSVALGRPVAPFFRFPFLADTRAMKAHLETRGLAAFSIEVDALDYRLKEDPQGVQAEVLKQLASVKKGILLFHDIQPVVAQALPGVLAALKARGFRVVHMVPKAAAVTLAEFDGIARREAASRRIAIAANPLAARALTWPAAPPAATAPPSAPASTAAAPPTGPTVPWGPPPPRPAGAPPETLPWATSPPPRPRPAREEADWRRDVFGN